MTIETRADSNDRLQFDGLRVAALIDTWAVSGPGRQLAALAQAIGSHGVEFRIYVIRRRGREASPYVEFLVETGVEHVVITEAGLFDPRILLAVRLSLRDWRPDVIQTHGYKPTAIAAAIRPADCPWIGFFHGETAENLKVRLYHRIDRLLLRQAHRLVVMSQLQHRSFAHLGSRVRLIHNAAIMPARDDGVVRGGKSGDPPTVGYLGRLSPEKGVDVLLRAAAQFRDAGSPLNLVIAGSGPEQGRLEDLARELDISAETRFRGHVRNPEELYGQLDLVVLPSRSEGLPNVLLEALNADVPVVATNVGAVSEVLFDPAAGELVAPDDSRALADAIRRALANGRRPDARLARAAAAKRFSLEHRVADHVRLYAELCPDRLS